MSALPHISPRAKARWMCGEGKEMNYTMVGGVATEAIGPTYRATAGLDLGAIAGHELEEGSSCSAGFTGGGEGRAPSWLAELR